MLTAPLNLNPMPPDPDRSPPPPSAARRRFSRRKFLRNASIAALLALADGRLWESHWLKLTSCAMKIGLANPVRILHLSDFHVSSSEHLWRLSRAIELGLAQKPDLACLTGDYLFGGKVKRAEEYVKTLLPLSRAIPMFACLGNNDGAWSDRTRSYSDTSGIIELLSSAQIKTLDNASDEVRVGDSILRIVGVGDAYCGKFNPWTAFTGKGKEAAGPVVALCHNPDYKRELLAFHWDALLCGHTHGGQVSIPFIGPPILPVKDRAYVGGLYSYQGRWMHITRGIGSWYGFRLNCRPEVSIVNLV